MPSSDSAPEFIAWLAGKDPGELVTLLFLMHRKMNKANRVIEQAKALLNWSELQAGKKDVLVNRDEIKPLWEAIAKFEYEHFIPEKKLKQ